MKYAMLSYVAKTENLRHTACQYLPLYFSMFKCVTCIIHHAVTIITVCVIKYSLCMLVTQINFSFDQVNKIYQPVYFQIRNNSSIRKILSDDTASILIHALTISRLDNGNGISNTLLDYLQ